MLELIKNYVIPKWKKYLKYKSEKIGPANVVPRNDTVWKKILRDVREFFRILFRVRFHPLEFKDTEGAKICTSILFEELGIPIEEMETSRPCLFRFIHQCHKAKAYVFENESDNESPYQAIEKYSENFRKIFMKHYLCSRMFYFVFKNFIQEYYPLVKPNYRKEIIHKI
jgi:hypothetical protein